MVSSVDGRILVEPHAAEGRQLWRACSERLHDELKGDSWLIGRVTGREPPRRSLLRRRRASVSARTLVRAARRGGLGIALDRHGKIAWGRSDIGGYPISWC